MSFEDLIYEITPPLNPFRLGKPFKANRYEWRTASQIDILRDKLRRIGRQNHRRAVLVVVRHG